MGNIQAKISSATVNTSSNSNKGNSEEILRAEVIGIVNEVDDGGVSSTSVGGEEEVEGRTTIVASAKDKGRGKLERKRYVVKVLYCWMSVVFAMNETITMPNHTRYNIRYRHCSSYSILSLCSPF